MKFAVTLKDLRDKSACFYGYNRLVLSLQGKEFSEKYQDRESYIKCSHNGLIPIEYILSSNGLDDALWALRCVKDADRDLRLFAVWCARQVQHLMNDERSLNALDVSERFANGQASESERAAARAAAGAAARAAAGDAAWAAARAATWAAAGDAARAAAWAAAGDAAWAAARAAARAATWDAAWAAAGDAAWAAAGDAARAAAWAAAGDAQSEMLIKMCRGKAPWQVCVEAFV